MGPAPLDGPRVRQVLVDVLKTVVEDDGLDFDLASLRLEPIGEASPVPGIPGEVRWVGRWELLPADRPYYPLLPPRARTAAST